MTVFIAFHSACKCKTDMLTKIRLAKKIKQHMNYKFYQENTLIKNYENILLQFQNRVHLESIYLSG